MKIHSDILTPADIVAAVRAVPGVSLSARDTGDGWYRPLPEHGSRSRARAFTLRLESDGTPDQHGAGRRRRVNFGTSHLDRFERPFAASYADWGHVLAALFALDPAATCDYYASAEDFHAKTAGAFRASDGTPAHDHADGPPRDVRGHLDAEHGLQGPFTVRDAEAAHTAAHA